MIYDENDDLEYDYHNIADSSDELYDDEYYYKDGVDEPWLGPWEGEDDDIAGWDNYYHDILDEIED